jgi:hypothetical protein
MTNRMIGSVDGARLECRIWRLRSRTVNSMSAQPTNSTHPYEVIHLGGEAAAIVPLADLRRLRAVEQLASAELREDAEIEATLAGHDEWTRTGRPGARPHDDVMAELLAE